MGRLTAGLAAFVMALGFTVAAAPAAHATVCPRVLGGDWYGDWTGTLNGQQVTHDLAAYTFFAGQNVPQTQLMGTIDDSMNGVGLRSYFLAVTINCDTLSFSTNEPYFGSTSWQATYTADSRNVSGSFTNSAGTFTFDAQVSADDAQSVSISDTSILEGDTGEHDALIPVTMTQPWTVAIPVQYQIIDMTAQRGVDYSDSGSPHTINIPKGQVQKNISVPIVPNDVRQNDRQFAVVIEYAPQQQIYSNVAVVTIRDDDYDKD